MDVSATNPQPVWPLWKKILFRFCFVYLALQIAPWTWLDYIPGAYYVTTYYYQFNDWLVNFFNSHVFHIRPVLVPINGSGDTSYGWTQLWMFLCLAAVGCIVWSIIQRKKANYIKLNYWLCLVTRYFVAITSLSYGILKLYALQMPFPNLHQLATPLGDLLPMRFSWMFIGYSGPYQIFSGIMETIAGLLLLYRRTATLGILLATAVFMNVMMLNLTYDIPVKIFSMQLTFCCLFLLANEAERIICFFILNKPAATCSLYHYTYPKKWMRITRVVLKLGIITVAVIMPFINNYDYYKQVHTPPKPQPVKNGVYDVAVYSINKQNIPASMSDTMRWHDVIFENGMGSIKTTDTLFRQRYRRAYFSYNLDSAQHTLLFKKFAADSNYILNLHYDLPDSNTIRLWGLQRSDSLYVELKRTNKSFQLAEKQFHWLSEYNR